jgi:hypothetical protein
MTELDLDAKTEAGVTGKPDDESTGAAPKPKRRGRPPGTKSHHRQPGRPPKAETELASRLDRVLERITSRLEERGDDELATAMREGGAAMAGGLTDLTRFAPAIRMPLLLILGLIEPVLAFGRVGRILSGRLLGRRERRAQEAAWAAQEAAGETEYVAGVPVAPEPIFQPAEF